MRRHKAGRGKREGQDGDREGDRDGRVREREGAATRMASMLLARAESLMKNAAGGNEAEEMQHALRLKSYALLQLSRFSEAMDVIDRQMKGAGNEELARSDGFLLQKAYCLYRLGKLEESLETSRALIENVGGSVTPVDDDAALDLNEAIKECRKSSTMMQSLLAALQIRAQVLMKLGRSSESARHLEAVMTASKSRRKDVDLITNLIAALASSGKRGDSAQGVSLSRESGTASFELVFNGACAMIELMTAKMMAIGVEDGANGEGESGADAITALGEEARERLSLAREMGEALLEGTSTDKPKRLFNHS